MGYAASLTCHLERQQLDGPLTLCRIGTIDFQDAFFCYDGPIAFRNRGMISLTSRCRNAFRSRAPVSSPFDFKFSDGHGPILSIALDLIANIR
jgi:hypothetical protein